MDSQKVSLRLKCMYTKHLVKKRKSWNDGYLTVTGTKSSSLCTLIDADDIRGIGIESRILESAELTKILKGEDFTLGLENHMVQLEAQSKSIAPTYKPPLKLPKFVPPSTVTPRIQAPQPHSIANHMQGNSTAIYGNTSRSSSSGAAQRMTGAYAVANDELDDIWGTQGTSNDSKTQHPQPGDHIPPHVTTIPSQNKTQVTVVRQGDRDCTEPVRNVSHHTMDRRDPIPQHAFSGTNASQNSLHRPRENYYTSEGKVETEGSIGKQLSAQQVSKPGNGVTIDASIWDDF